MYTCGCQHSTAQHSTAQHSTIQIGKSCFDLRHQPRKASLLCSPGWLVHWGEKMANTSAKVLTDSFSEILAYANGTGSVNFYMAHGGTNFGWTPGLFFVVFPACNLATEALMIQHMPSQIPAQIPLPRFCILIICDVTCVSGHDKSKINEVYSQCVPAC